MKILKIKMEAVQGMRLSMFRKAECVDICRKIKSMLTKNGIWDLLRMTAGPIGDIAALL